MILCSRNIMFWLHNIFVGSWGWIWYGEPFDSICPFVLLLHQFLLLFGAQGNPIIMFGLRTFVLSISPVLWCSGQSNNYVWPSYICSINLFCSLVLWSIQ